LIKQICTNFFNPDNLLNQRSIGADFSVYLKMEITFQFKNIIIYMD